MESGVLQTDSLQEVIFLLQGMEERLTLRFDCLPVQLEEYQKQITAVVSKKSVKYSRTSRGFATTPLTPGDKDDAVAPAVSVGTEHVFQNGQEAGSETLSPTPGGLTDNGCSPSVLQKETGLSVNESRPVWKKFGARPSEAAKAFVRDALTKTQKKKIMKTMKYGAGPIAVDEGQGPVNPALPGIDAVLDLKKEDTTHGTFTETMHGWWNPESEDAEWLVNAKRKAHRLKSSVYDLLLSKGWVAPQAHISSTKKMIKLSKFERMISSTKFEMWCSSMIMLNAILLGYQTQHRADPRNAGESVAWLEAAQIAFTVWFSAEVFLRMYAWKFNFFLAKDFRWNIFDLVVVTVSVIELILQKSTGEDVSSNFAVVRMIRILRLVRAVRFIRVVRFFAELRMMIYSSLKSVKPFCWALGILLLIIYVFAIVTTQIVGDYRLEYPDEDVKLMCYFFGSLHQSIYTLFMVISGGVSWIEPADELLKVHWSFAIWMSLYVAFVMFAVLNIVTGIFIESALKSAQDDQDVVIQEEMNHEDSLAQGFLEVFQQCDDDKSGYIDAEEFDAHLSDHRVRAFLHHLGLDIPEAHGLFRLLDIAGTGRVYAKEFVLGCQQLKGPAKNVDVATLLFQNKRMMTLWAVFMSFVEDQFALLVSRGDIVDASTESNMTALSSATRAELRSI